MIQIYLLKSFLITLSFIFICKNRNDKTYTKIFERSQRSTRSSDVAQVVACVKNYFVIVRTWRYGSEAPNRGQSEPSDK